jgi:hypothetical protein
MIRSDLAKWLDSLDQSYRAFDSVLDKAASTPRRRTRAGTLNTGASLAWWLPVYAFERHNLIGVATGLAAMS